MNILIIGGNGFLGSKLAEKLHLSGHKVTIFDNVIKKNQSKKIKFILGSILNYKQISKAFIKKDIVFNFAAVSDIEESINKPKLTANVNIIGNLNAIESAIKHKIKKFIFASTIYVHSSQGGFYKVSKQSSELFLEEYYRRKKLPYTILRFGTIYGPGSSKNNGLKKIVYKAIKQRKLEYSGSRKAKRRFLHVDDAVRACMKTISPKYNNKNLLITGDKIFKLTSVMKVVQQVFQLKSKIKFLNKKGSGHYDKSPYSYVPKKDKNFFVKSKKTLITGIKELRDEIKK
tara:strand:- start:482 stop:1342 length:861 start_codon:yes stop_codon:yes gene_type:complete